VSGWSFEDTAVFRLVALDDNDLPGIEFIDQAGGLGGEQHLGMSRGGPDHAGQRRDGGGVQTEFRFVEDDEFLECPGRHEIEHPEKRYQIALSRPLAQRSTVTSPKSIDCPSGPTDLKPQSKIPLSFLVNCIIIVSMVRGLPIPGEATS
jgi:hypothetical protein